MMNAVQNQTSEDVCVSSLLARAEAAAALISMRETVYPQNSEASPTSLQISTDTYNIPSPVLDSWVIPASVMVNNSTEHSPSPASLVLEDTQSHSPMSLATDDESLPKLNNPASGTTKKRTSKANMLKFPPCVICDGKASGLHYGSNTCEACKNFYRRYLIGKQSYICVKNDDCEISFKNRGNCSACRLAKCLAQGMSKEKSKMGRYSYTRRTETIKKVKEIEEKEQISKSSLQLSSDEQAHNSGIQHVLGCSRQAEGRPSDRNGYNGQLLLFDTDVMNALILAKAEIKPYGDEITSQQQLEEKLHEHHEKYTMKVETFGSMKNLSMEEYRSLLNLGIDIDDQFSFMISSEEDWTAVVGRYCKFAKKIPGFSSLNYPDQSNLLKTTHCEFFLLLIHRCYLKKLGIYMDIGGTAFHVDEVANRFFTREMLTNVCEVFVYFQSLDISDEELVLLLSLVTMSTDVCKLENYKLVEEVQLQCMTALQQLISSKFERSAASRRLGKFVDGLVKMRESASLYYKSFQTLCNDEKLMKEIPTMASLLPDEY